MWRLATSVSYVKADSTAFSMLFFLRTTHLISLVYQITMNHLSPNCQIILPTARSVPAITIQLGSIWQLLNQIFGPLGSCDALLGILTTDIFAAQMTTRRPHFRAKIDEEEQYYLFQYRLTARTPLRKRLLASGW